MIPTSSSTSSTVTPTIRLAGPAPISMFACGSNFTSFHTSFLLFDEDILLDIPTLDIDALAASGGLPVFFQNGVTAFLLLFDKCASIAAITF